MKDILLEYIRYNEWANHRLNQFILSNCSEEQVEQEQKSSFPSIKKTLLHIWGAQAIWLDRLKEINPVSWRGADFNGSSSDLCLEISKTDKGFIEFVESCGEDYLASQFSYKNLEGKEFRSKRAEAIMHCVNHSTYHRGQVVTLLRQAGLTSLISTDFIAWCRER